MLTREKLQELFYYDPESGHLTRRKTFNNRARKGQRAGCIDSKGSGYRRIGINGRLHMEHRIIWLLVTGNAPSQIDHINGNKADNRWINLREASPGENQQNRKPKQNSKTGRQGVSPTKYGRFTAFIYLDKRRHYLGTFPTVDSAYAAYLSAKEQLHPFNPVPRMIQG